MRLLVLGAGGQLGCDILARAEGHGVVAEGVGHAQCDIALVSQVRELFDTGSYDAVINAAAYTKVDLAEADEELADRVNRVGAGVVADQCRANGLPLLHVSTDYVFDGNATEPYSHLAEVSPQSVYGNTKAEGERLVLEMHPDAAVVRTSWLFGEHGPNFVKTMVRLAFERETLRVVNDQVGCPTWTGGLADALLTMVTKTVSEDVKARGIYHYCGAPQSSWFEFARYIIDEARQYDEPKVRELLPIPTEEYPTPATRPMYSVLDCSRLEKEFGVVPGDWRYGVRQVLKAEFSRLGGRP
ncbi:NAD(P)-dependent oxidoreductase [Desulfoluna limicola]|uniref:dTDP-4-dehydrorhamnose reductase n=1 Tax=Desulfoluna limicola TaxID=2810562 RepID=A0ABN6F4A3_9BACT|nr:dTDP-4-dehydrorhamnose reductase [Desulfoluna limicola]BCS96465.1 NAD(P)-dependent oxidoreductase [Desulfoluna limicola]